MTVKNKLIEKRIEKGYSQKEVAQMIGKEISGYNRRENGTVKISRNEWNKLAEVLECDFKDIYEPDDNVYVINGDYAQGNFGNNGTFNQTPEYLLELQQKYIAKIEEENTSSSAKSPDFAVNK
jgi:DNA-binding XRE family transcriptional regulator